MSDELDFSKLTIDDVKLGGVETTPTADPAEGTNGQTEGTPAEGQNNPAPDPVKDPAVDPAKDPAVDPAKEPAKDPAKEPAKEDPKPAEYKFKDDFIKQAVEYYEKTGDLTAYLQAKLVDFEQMSDEEIMRRDLREAYPDVSDKAFDKLFKQQVVDKFKLDADAFEEDDVELGKELLKSEASKLRAKYQEWQKGFKAPEPTPDTSAQEAEKAIQEFTEKVKSNEVTKSILTDKRIAIKTPDGDLASPDALLDMTLDNTKFFSQFAGQDGQIDYNKWYLTSAFSQDPEGFIKSIGNYFKGLGREEVAKEIKNPSNNSVGDVPTDGSGDFKTGLLQAFANRGVSK